MPCWLKFPDAAAEAEVHCAASTGRLANVKMADIPSPAPVSLRREVFIAEWVGASLVGTDVWGKLDGESAMGNL